MNNPKMVIISGASSGIGATLAKAYAAPGIKLYLTARRESLLEEVAATCRTRGAETHILAADITDYETIRRWLLEIDEKHPVDILIANAGISAGSGGFGGESAQQARDIFNTNVIGVANLVLPILPRMMKRKSGNIAIMASMAALRGLPGAPAYSASKAAVLAYGDALRGYALASGVKVSVICPGYIKSSAYYNKGNRKRKTKDCVPDYTLYKHETGKRPARYGFRPDISICAF